MGPWTKLYNLERGRKMTTELMTLQEAIREVDNMGIITRKTFPPGAGIIVNKENGKFYRQDSPKVEQHMKHVHWFLYNDWQIIPAETEVLTANQSYLKSSVYKENYRKPPQEYIVGFNNGDQNGQLKEWLNHQELREAVETVIKYYPNVDRIEIKNLCRITRNLKPFKPE